MTYIIGIDYGLPTNETAFAIVDIDNKTAIRAAKVQTRHWDELLRLIRRLNQEWQPKQIWVEGNGHQTILETLMADKLPIRQVAVTVKTKQEMVIALKTAIESGELTLAPNIKVDKHLALEIAWYGVNFQPIELNFN